MTDWSILDRLPPAWRVERGSAGAFAAREEWATAFAAAGYSLTTQSAVRESDLAGRGAMGELTLGAERFVVRRFQHGGLLRWMTGRRYRDPLRPFREALLGERLHAAGILTPEVVAAAARRASVAGFELELVTRRIEGGVDLGSVARRAARGDLDPVFARDCARAFGALVARLHAIGFWHADLTPRNVVVQGTGGESLALWILDLDGSRFVAAMGRDERVANLARLWRHARRMARQGHLARPERHAVAFLLGYTRSRAERRELASAVLRRDQRGRAWHAAGEALERGVGARRSEPQA